jgi:hypothetical protein
MHRSLTALLALGAACSLMLGPRAEANPEAQLLERYRRDNAEGAAKASASVTAAVAAAKESLKTDPMQAVQSLRAAHIDLERQSNLSAGERRRLVAELQQHIDAAVHAALLKLPGGAGTALKYKDNADNRASNDYGAARARLVEVPATLLFCNGVQYEAVVHSVSAQTVRCTLQGQRFVFPGSLLPAIRVQQGYFLFDHALAAFIYVSKAQLNGGAQLWRARTADHAPGNGNGAPFWEVLAKRFVNHGSHLAAVCQHGRPAEVAAFVERHFPELERLSRDPRLEHQIGELMPDADHNYRRAIRGLIAAYADKSSNWHFSKPTTRAALIPRLRAAAPNLTPMQEERLAEFILAKAEEEMQRRPL